MADVSLIIPVRAGRARLLARCLDSALGLADPPAEIVVVEDGSADPELPGVIAGRPGARLLRLPRPEGAAAARNAGVAASGGAFLWFLDSDSLVDDPGALAAALALMAEVPELGAVGGEITATAAGRRMPLKSLARCGSAYTQWADPAEVRRRPVDYLPTCACLVRREAFYACGGFDPAYRFLSEDTDLCARLWRWGWRVWADGRCGVLHDQSHGVGQGDLDPMLRNELRYALLHLPARSLPALPLHQLRFALDPRTRARLDEGSAGVLKHLPGGAGEAAPGLTRVGLRYGRGLVRAWAWNLARLGEAREARRALREAPSPPRFPPRGQ